MKISIKKSYTSIILIVTLCMFMSLCGYQVSGNDVSPNEIFVSIKGSDLNEGTIDLPLRSIDGAKKKVRELKQKSAIGANGIKVILREGIYNICDGLEFTKEDSGEINAPICYESYENETVRVTNGVELDTSKFEKVTDKNVLERMPIEAQDKVYQINLAKEGITDYGSIVPVNIYQPYTPSSSLLIVDDDMMRIAEWPNNDYAHIKEVLPTQTGYSFTINENRIARWKTANDVWVYGQFMYEWADDTLKIKSFDAKNKIISTENTTYLGIAADRKIKMINLLEELDIPGEWYLDRTNGMLYLYPKKSISQSSIVLSTKAKPLVTLNKAEYITFSNIIFEGTCASAIVINEGKNNLISNCEIRNIGQQAVEIIDGKRNGIERCHIHDIGKGGVSIIGGDVVNLTPSENYVENCHIERYDTIATKGSNAILLRGVGDRLSHCRIHNGSHRAIGFSGQNNIIEYNDIYDVLRDTMDAGAIYTGRSWVDGGTVIRYNYIHDCLKNPNDTGRSGIYLDDWMTGIKVYGNVMYNMNMGVALHSTQYCEVTNNMFINCGASIRNGNEYGYPNETIEKHNALIDELYKKGTLKDNYQSVSLVDSNDMFSKYYQLYDPNNSEWNRQFPYLKTIAGDGKALSPKHNLINKNVTFTGGCKQYNNDTPIYNAGLSLETSAVENNYTTLEKAVMVDEENGNYNLADYLAVDQNVSGFEHLDIKKAGIEGETSAVLKDFNLVAPISGAINVDAKDVILTWEEKSGAEKYRLTVAKDTDFKDIVFDDIVVHNYKKFTHLRYGKQTYYWKVQALTTSLLYQNDKTKWNSNGVFAFRTLDRENIDRNGLALEIEKAKAAYDSAVEGSLSGQYKVGAKSKFISYLENAKKALGARDVSKKAIDDSETQLSTQLKAFICDRNPEQLDVVNIIRDKAHWSGNVQLTNNSAIFNGDASAGYTGVNLQSYHLLKFKAMFNLTGGGFTSFGLRAGSVTVEPWLTQEYIFLVKQDTIELQKFNNGNNFLYSVQNNFIKQDKKHDISFCAITVDNGVNIILKVDEVEVFNFIDKENPVNWNGGFHVYNTGGSKVQIFASE